jgi:hypothetical protein
MTPISRGTIDGVCTRAKDILSQEAQDVSVTTLGARRKVAVPGPQLRSVCLGGIGGGRREHSGDRFQYFSRRSKLCWLHSPEGTPDSGLNGPFRFDVQTLPFGRQNEQFPPAIAWIHSLVHQTLPAKALQDAGKRARM